MSIRRWFVGVLIIIGQCGMYSSAYQSSDYYVARVESLIANRGVGSRLLFLKALDYLRVTGESEKIRILADEIYQRIMITFDGCGLPSKYDRDDVLWYNDFQKTVNNVDIGFGVEGMERFEYWDTQKISEMCYSSNGQIVVFNVPYMFNGDGKSYFDIERLSPSTANKKEVFYQDPHNIFLYDISNKTLKKATRYAQHYNIWGPKQANDFASMKPIIFHSWNESSSRYSDGDIAQIIFGFGKRVQDRIEMKSGYGDAGCFEDNIYAYNFIKNEIRLKRRCSGCEDETSCQDF